MKIVLIYLLAKQRTKESGVTSHEFARLLLELPDKELLIARGDFGPCRITDTPKESVVEMKPNGQSCWELWGYPDIKREEGDLPLKEVIII